MHRPLLGRIAEPDARSSRSRSQQGILTFLARDADTRVLCYAHAGIPKAEQANEVLRFVDFWEHELRQKPIIVPMPIVPGQTNNSPPAKSRSERAGSVGMAAGGALRGRFSEKTFRRVFFGGLLALGAHLASRALS